VNKQRRYSQMKNITLLMRHLCYHQKLGNFWVGDEQVCHKCFVNEIKRRARKQIEGSAYGGRLEAE